MCLHHGFGSVSLEDDVEVRKSSDPLRTLWSWAFGRTRPTHAHRPESLTLIEPRSNVTVDWPNGLTTPPIWEATVCVVARHVLRAELAWGLLRSMPTSTDVANDAIGDSRY